MNKDVGAAVQPPPARGLDVNDIHHAPFLYFDGASNFGCNNGIVNVTVAAYRYLSEPRGIVGDVIAVAHLRCTLAAAADLRDALDKAIAMATPPKSDAAGG